MITGFNLTYNLNLSWFKYNFSRGYKLLQVFWNTLYMFISNRRPQEFHYTPIVNDCWTVRPAVKLNWILYNFGKLLSLKLSDFTQHPFFVRLHFSAKELML